MKHILNFILILASSWVLACGPYYPYGESVRFSLLHPSVFNIGQYNAFNYSAWSFSSNAEDDYSGNSNYIEGSSTSLNLDLWRKRCKNKPDKVDVFRAVYVMDQINDSLTSNNSFIRYIVNHKDKVAIDYLSFAQRCSKYNGYIEDPWERNREVVALQRDELIARALTQIEAIKDVNIKKRYAFIAIRLAYYNGDNAQIASIYKDHFSDDIANPNIIDYWAMYFYNALKKTGAEKNYYAAKIFTHAPDKRFMSYRQYNKKTPIYKTLKWAKNDKEKAAIWLMEGVHKPSKALHIIKKMYQLDPGSEGLSFLLLREINKLEDWIFTPYYTNFEPSIYAWDENSPYNNYQSSNIRIANDRVYAAKVLSFVNGIDLDKVNDRDAWLTAKSYLHFMTDNHQEGLNTIAQLEENKTKHGKELRQLLSMIKALCLTKQQANDEAVIVEEIQTVLMEQDQNRNHQFLFAIARELEYKGNSTDAAIIMSNMYAQYDWHSKVVHWKTKLRHTTLYADFYDHYIFYLDAQYSPEQMKELITNVNTNQKKAGRFNQWKYQAIQYDIPRLYDLTGTKYIRKNKLSKALDMFKQVDDTLWTSKHFSYADYLDANPFYANFYSGHGHVSADSTKYNKETIVKQLITHLQLAEDGSSKGSEYHYFAAANCYFNMTHHGNSWMMRRYYWTRNNSITKLEDDEEYNHANWAKHYYLKAGKASNRNKFLALCLRMAGRCEQHRLRDEPNYHYTDNLLKKNKYYLQIQNEYPNYYDDLITNCTSFDKYYQSRN